MTRAMYMSKLYAPTLKEDPADAELASHRLLLRAGMIRKEAAGLYSYLPLAWRSIRKIENIVREEMEAAGVGAWQYFAVVPDMRATGVRDGVRAYEWPAIIRAINTRKAAMEEE